MGVPSPLVGEGPLREAKQGEGSAFTAHQSEVKSRTPSLRAARASLSHKGRGKTYAGSTTTGIFPMRACHSRGPVSCTDSPVESTATVTGMSCTVNS